jgi:hypothetical protein
MKQLSFELPTHQTLLADLSAARSRVDECEAALATADFKLWEAEQKLREYEASLPRVAERKTGYAADGRFTYNGGEQCE